MSHFYLVCTIFLSLKFEFISCTTITIISHFPRHFSKLHPVYICNVFYYIFLCNILLCTLLLPSQMSMLFLLRGYTHIVYITHCSVVVPLELDSLFISVLISFFSRSVWFIFFFIAHSLSYCIFHDDTAVNG